MSSIGTFGSFTTARLGIYSAHKGLSVTGNNISNINTVGYTRQSLDQVSLHVGGADRYHSSYDVKIGNGALAVGVSQLRDPYLDIRYRSESASVGAMNAKLEGLNNLAAIFDEVGDGDDENGVIGAQFSDLLRALQNLTDQTNQGQYDTQVRTSAETLVTLFNSAASQLEEIRKNTVTGMEKKVTEVNEILNNIRDLNTSIRKSEIHGDPALELRDERNRLIDDLSEFVKIDVIYSEEDIGCGMTVEKLSIRLGNANPDASVDTDTALLVDGMFSTQLSIRTTPKLNEGADKDVNPYLKPDGTPTADEAEADQVYSENYDINLSKLYDYRGREWEDVSKPKTTAFKTEADYNAAQAANPAGTVDDGKGTKTTTAYYTTTTKDAAGKDVTNYICAVTTAKYTQEVALDDNDLYGSLQATRETLSEAGEFTTKDHIANIDEGAATKRGIPYYQHSLDLLARQFATIMNEANNGYMVNEKNEYIDKDGNVLTEGGNPIVKGTDLTDAQKAVVEADGYRPEGFGNLFSNHGDGDDAEGITAANLSIAAKWASGDVNIVSTYIRPTNFDESASTQNSNVVHMRALLEESFDYFPSSVVDDASGVPMFRGNFASMFNSIGGVLANDQRSTNIKLNSYYNRAIELDTGRDSVSGVDLNDEAMNLMQYQKSYSAACRLMTTLDEALDKLINGTGTTGR